jgi:hypothetical protein
LILFRHGSNAEVRQTDRISDHYGHIAAPEIMLFLGGFFLAKAAPNTSSLSTWPAY